MSDEREQGARDEQDGGDGGDGKRSKETVSRFRQEPAPSLLEWSVRALSLLLLLALTGYVVWQAFQPLEPTRFSYSADKDEVRQEEDSWVLPVSVTNEGTRSLADFELTVELVDAAGEVVDKESMAMALVGQKETKRMELWFDRDPRELSVRFDVTGYQIP